MNLFWCLKLQKKKHYVIVEQFIYFTLPWLRCEAFTGNHTRMAPKMGNQSILIPEIK